MLSIKKKKRERKTGRERENQSVVGGSSKIRTKLLHPEFESFGEVVSIAVTRMHGERERKDNLNRNLL
jgi:hypothetical protein